MTPAPSHAPVHAYDPRLPWGLVLVLRFLMSLFADIGMELPADSIARVRLRRSDADCDPDILLLEAAVRSLRAEWRRAGTCARARRQILQLSGHAEIIPTPADQATAHPASHPTAARPIARRRSSRPPWPPPRAKLAYTCRRFSVPI